MKIVLSIVLGLLIVWTITLFDFSNEVEDIDGVRYVAGEIFVTKCEFEGRKNTAYYDFTFTDGREIMVRVYGNCSGALPYFKGRHLYGYFIGGNPMKLKVGDEVLVSFSRGKLELNSTVGWALLCLLIFFCMINFPGTRKKLVKKLRVHVLGKKE